jgi:hypothetical protein
LAGFSVANAIYDKVDNFQFLRIKDLKPTAPRVKARREERTRELHCDYLDKYGSNVFKILGKSEKDNSITYAEFDYIDAIARQLYKELMELSESATPVTEVSDELRDAMKEVIGSSVH